ncbi:Hypothetical protein SMAX5B_018789 [Scophthalmus maximus]|uniref:Uncharacterized protein n=1 Tax=Scophthalmus maximus TaxID=52904 RepID=A0A2U9BSG0_SCOMX|nr:Hypothetical protein SMAX5B_018789 [Scophthalmus maximus]
MNVLRTGGCDEASTAFTPQGTSYQVSCRRADKHAFWRCTVHPDSLVDSVEEVVKKKGNFQRAKRPAAANDESVLTCMSWLLLHHHWQCICLTSAIPNSTRSDVAVGGVNVVTPQ